MPNNQDLFNAAVAGIAGGCSERWITNTSPASYEGFRDAVEALANAVDTLIPPAGGIGNDQARVMQSLCQGVMANRLITSTDPNDYADIAAAIVACYTEIITIVTSTSPPEAIAYIVTQGEFNAPGAGMFNVVITLGEPLLQFAGFPLLHLFRGEPPGGLMVSGGWVNSEGNLELRVQVAAADFYAWDTTLYVYPNDPS